MTEAEYEVPGLQDLPAAWRKIVVTLLDYADQRGLHKYRRDSGWTLKKRHHAIFQIRIYKQPKGVVPQLRYLRMWNDKAMVDELHSRLSGLIDVHESHFPTVSMKKLEDHPEVLPQLCEIFDWFLEQTGDRTPQK
jgi:hypothetical protein